MIKQLLNKIKCKLFFCSKCSINIEDEELFITDKIKIDK